MEVEISVLQALLDSVCDRVRGSVRQSNETVVQKSRTRLVHVPSDHSALQVVAASSLMRSQPGKSLDLLQRDPQHLHCDPLSNRIAGYAWLVKEEPRRAKQRFDDAVRLDPNQPDCWKWLGRLAEQEDELDQATEYYERGILFDDGRHESALALSKMQARNRQLAEAIHTLRVCLIRDRRSSELNLALARLLFRRAGLMGRRRRFVVQERLRKEALDCYRVVNATAPTGQSLILQGKLQQQLADYDGARESFRRAVSLEPKSAAALSHLAGSNVDFGDIDSALEQYEQSISIDPERSETHFRYSRAKRFKSSSATRRYLRQLQTLLSGMEGERQRQKRVHLLFAMAKVNDDLGQYDRAWHCYDQANRLKTEAAAKPAGQMSEMGCDQNGSPTKVSPLGDLVDQATEFYTPDRFEQMAGAGSESRMPIFVVGMPRSGTTLTEQILSSHPEIAGAGELTDLNRIRHEITRSVTRRSGDAASANRSYPELLASVDRYDLRRHADQYLARLDHFRHDETHVTDKMPTNFMHLGLIAILFPGATVIHCRRNPMDVLVSCYCQNLNPPFCHLEQMVRYYRDYTRLMSHWRSVLPIRILDSDYESLVSDPEPNSRALIEHCGLPWDDACLRFQDNARAVHTPSKWQVRQPMYRSSVEKWRRFERHLARIAQRIFGNVA